MPYTSNAVASQGFTLAVQTASGPAVFTDVKEVKSFSGFDGQRSEIDVTHLQSPAKEKRLGLKDYGTVTFDVNFVSEDPGQIALRALLDEDEPTNFKCTYSDGSTDEFSGLVRQIPKNGSVDGVIESSFAITITGDVEFTAAP